MTDMRTDESRALTTEEAGSLRAVAIGSVIGAVVAFLVVSAGLWASGYRSAEAFGIGAMAAFWGGLGFGSMIGGVTFVSRLAELDE